MNNNNKNNDKYWIGAVIGVLVLIAISLFTFSYQRSVDAYEMGVQNRERISVIESKMDEVSQKLDEVRSDIKILLRAQGK